MSESLYMMEIKQILEEVSLYAGERDAARRDFEGMKKAAVDRLVRQYGLNLDDAQSEVAAAAGEEP